MPLPVISVAQMREWERASWAAGILEEGVMRRAGAAVAARVLARTWPGDTVLVLAGKGHNGDDARFAAEGLLDRHGRVLRVADPAASLAEAREAPATLVVDGLFGIGLNRPLDAAWNAFIREVNARHLPVIAVDVPSGLDADTGEPLGEVLRATVTVTFGAVKRGLVSAKAVPFVGRLELAHEIGLVACPFPEADLNWMLAQDFRGVPPARPVDGHKGSFGHLAILAGSTGYHGAAVLAADGALRAMPGLVTVFTTGPAYVAVASQLQQAMVRPWAPGMALPERCSAVLFGPGLAAADVPAELKAETARLWREADVPVVADASGLSWLPAGPVREGAVRVITPHPGEAARLLGRSVEDVQSDRAAALRELSRRFGNAWVVLKGHQTLVGRSAGPLFINPTGNPGLAQGGTGDVMAGFLGGWLAQPAMQEDALRTIRFAVFHHGAGADLLASKCRAWTVQDLLGALSG